jgi:site-specific recombinase XerD
LLNEKKTDKKRIISINKDLQNIISWSYSILNSDPESWIMINEQRYHDRPVSVQNLNIKLKKYFADYNIKVENPTSHTLRKTFGKRVYEMNCKSEDSLILLSQIFNHSSVAITRKYIGITKERIRNVYLNM